MRSKILGLLMLGAILVPSTSYAGWGAVACDVNGSGACGASSGWANLYAAKWHAMMACRAGGYFCYVHSWEHNMCTQGLNGSYACN